VSAAAPPRVQTADELIALAVAAVADGEDFDVWVGFLVGALGERGRSLSTGQAATLITAAVVW
jgi:hypothetical protein